MRMRTNFVAAVCLACWLFIASFPVSGYNSLNESSEAALLLNISALESGQVDEMPENLTDMGSVDDSSINCVNRLSIVDYWGNRYSCNAKCVFLHDVSRMIIAPCKRGLLKLYEEYPDNTVLQSGYIPVSANRRYNWWFIGDIEEKHTMWFEIYDRYGNLVSESNRVEYMVVPENCPGIENCSPSSRHA
jgi:hypothetical protein